MAITKEVHQVAFDRKTSPLTLLAAIGGRQQISLEIIRAMPNGLGAEVTEFIVARPKLDRYADDQVTSEEVSRLYAENCIFPDPHVFLWAILMDSSLRDGRHYAAQWKVGEDHFFLSACYHKGEWYIHAGRSPESWGEEWHFVGTPPVKMDPLF